MTCREVADYAEHLSYGFEALNMAPAITAEDKEWRFIAIQSKNRKEWNLTNLANMHQKITTVSLYDTLGVEATKFILNQTELITIVVANDYISKLCKLKIEDAKSETPQAFRLKFIVAYEDRITDEERELAKTAEIELYTLDGVVAIGKEQAAQGRRITREATPDTVYMFSYTSGTTGDPKGVKLTHQMMIQCANAMAIRLNKGMECFDTRDCYISYLPAAHSFEQATSAMSLVFGMKTGFFGGDVLKLTEDMQILKPTFFPSVPRLFNRIYGKIQDNIKAATGMKGYLVQQAISGKSYYH